MAHRRTTLLALHTLAVVGLALALPAVAHAGIISDLFGLPNVNDIVVGLLVRVGNLLIWALGLILWICGRFFDVAIYFSVVKFSEFATMEPIKIAWSTARDIANIFFIFILLYIAIGTILRLNGIDTQRMVVKVIIIALLINFSRVLTGVVIDSGNVLAFQFYKALRDGDTSQGLSQEHSISQTFVSALKMQEHLNEPEESDLSAEATPDQGEMSPLAVIANTIGASVLILVTAFVLFAAAILFMLRLISLIFIIILSPLAFLAFAFPTQENHYNKWSTKLIKQTFFAPAYLFMLYLVARIIQHEAFQNFADIGGPGTGSVGRQALNTIVNYIIVIGLMLGSLKIATDMGAEGANTVSKWKDKLTGRAQGYAKDTARGAAQWAGRKTVGFLARNVAGKGGRALAESGGLKSFEKKGSSVARGLRNLGKRGQDVDLGFKGASLSAFAEGKLKGKNLDDYKGNPEAQAQILAGLHPEARLSYYRKLEAKDRAALEASTINDPKLTEVFKKMRVQLPNEKDVKDTGKALDIAKAERNVSDGLKLLKEKGLIPSLNDDGQVQRDASGNIVAATAANEEEKAALMKKFTKLIKPNKDTAGAIADALKFNGNEEEVATSKLLIQSLSNNQLNNLLKPESIDAMKDSDGTLEGIRDSINGLPDDNSLKQYVRNTPAFSALLDIKKLKVSPELKGHLDVISTTTSSDENIREALKEISVKDMKHVAERLDPKNIDHTERVLKNLSTAKVTALAKDFTANQRKEFDDVYRERAPEDPYLEDHLKVMGVKYKGRPEEPTPTPTPAGGGGGGAVGGRVNVVVGTSAPTQAAPGPQIVRPSGADLRGTPGPSAQRYPSTPQTPPPAPQTPQSAPPQNQGGRLQSSVEIAMARTTPTPTPQGGASDVRMESQALDLSNVGGVPKRNPSTKEEEVAAQEALEVALKNKQSGEIKTEKSMSPEMAQMVDNINRNTPPRQKSAAEQEDEKNLAEWKKLENPPPTT